MKKNYFALTSLLCSVVLTSCSSPSATVTKENISAAEKPIHQKKITYPAKIEILKDERKGLIPSTIEIPAINVKTKIEQVGTLSDGRMDVPKNPDHVGWYEPGTLPGAQGNAVLAGHVDDLTSPAVFYELHKLKKGDKILLKDKNGQNLTFEVYDQRTFPRLDAPIEDIFGFSYASTLNLITCSGEYDPDTTERSERTVVYTKLAEEQ